MRRRGCVVVDDEGGVVVRVEKWGGGVLGGKEVMEVVGLAGERWREWKKVLERT